MKYNCFHQQRDHASQTSYCNSHSMKLLAIESYPEDQAIQSAWGTTSECNYKLMLGGYHQQIPQSFNMRINFKLNLFRIKVKLASF